MDLGIAGKRAVVLGSSRGLGFGIAKNLSQEGVKVLLVGRDEERLKSSVADIQDGTGNRESAGYVVADLGDKDAASKIYEAAVNQLGGVDILVNNGGGPKPGSVATVDSAEWVAQFEAMILRALELTSLCLPAMREQKWGRIINLLSSGVPQPIPNLGMSNTLRGSLVGWAKTLSNEVAAEGVTVNNLVPGRIHTDRVDKLDAAAAKRQDKTVEQIATASRATIPTGRYGRVDEFASVATFLASEKASYVNGTSIRVDGGMIRSI